MNKGEVRAKNWHLQEDKEPSKAYTSKRTNKVPTNGVVLGRVWKTESLGKMVPAQKKPEKADGREEAISVPSLCPEVNSVVIEHELACAAKIFGAQEVCAKQWEEHKKEVNLGSFVMERGGYRTCGSVFCEMKNLEIIFPTEHAWKV